MEITKSQLNQFDQVGFFKMDRVISRKGFQEIRERMEDITQGRIQYPGMSFQLDGSSKVSVNAELKIGLKYKLLSPIIKNKYKAILTSLLYKMNNTIMNA